jgi:hypothetical protein
MQKLNVRLYFPPLRATAISRKRGINCAKLVW